MSGDLYTVVAPAAGKVASWNIEEGKDVSKDDEVAKIQSEDGEKQLQYQRMVKSSKHR